MKAAARTEFGANARGERFDGGSSRTLALIRATSRSASTRILRIQQAPSVHEDVCEGSARFEPVQVLVQTSVSNLLEAKHPLDHADRMLDLRPHARLGAVASFDRLIDAITPPIALIGEVLRARRRLAHLLFLSPISLISPHPGLLAVQQMWQGKR